MRKVYANWKPLSWLFGMCGIQIVDCWQSQIQYYTHRDSQEAKTSVGEEKELPSNRFLNIGYAIVIQ